MPAPTAPPPPPLGPPTPPPPPGGPRTIFTLSTDPHCDRHCQRRSPSGAASSSPLPHLHLITIENIKLYKYARLARKPGVQLKTKAMAGNCTCNSESQKFGT
ncbi:hypothetical protein CKAN_02096100 [Cinnamomum micranthum f. kanehirae]|uniref:Uncharacterized protein n=1 Tax=Cinnamomum micranthum f. kanehirae TaxID=337451 RepID=A0A443PLY8_9MAGN|nr:hypothetical protein CKAN_02096100 [Cinnamomum micranthum f. kanehirae]